MTDVMLLTKTELAVELGIAASGVSKMIARGLPVRLDGRVNMERACVWIRDHTLAGPARSAACMWLELLRMPDRDFGGGWGDELEHSENEHSEGGEGERGES
jgi:hypothetical protein